MSVHGFEWLDGQTPAPSEGFLDGHIPALFGGNFQAVSVAQKLYGYENDSTNSFTPQLIRALTFVDNSIGLVVNKLKAKGLFEETSIVVASKHGQAPIQRSLYNTVDPEVIPNATGVDVVFRTSDDIALIFLKNQADVQKAADGLNAHRKQRKIRAVTYGQNITDSGFGNPLTDPAVPDIIVQPELGNIYTTSTKKIAERGGISLDNRLAAAFVSNPKLRQKNFTDQVYTTQLAATILTALDLPVSELQGAQIQRTQVLPGFPAQHGWW
jgi:arylsulfatase A-like enzyme